MQCWKWIQIQGSNPNTGQEINEYRCADNWQVFLAMEHSLYERQTGAAVESFRNEMVTQNNQLLTNISNKALKDVSSNH